MFIPDSIKVDYRETAAAALNAQRIEGDQDKGKATPAASRPILVARSGPTVVTTISH
jgi:hypothetical protein